MNKPPTTEDRIWAILSHLAALTLGIGIVLPIIGWSDQRRKSNYAAFQCLQALGYQSLGFTIWVLSFLVVIILTSVILLALPGWIDVGRQSGDALFRPGIVLFFTVFIGFFALYLILPVVAAAACAFGRDFRYPIMGVRLARYLQYEPAQTFKEQMQLDEAREFRWVAGMGHFSVLIFIWGMLAPLVTWLLHGRHNSFLEFQSMQGLIYQAITTITGFIGGILYFLGLTFLLAGMGAIGDFTSSPSIGIVIIVAFGVLLLIAFVLILIVPVLHILGQWAGYRVLKGDNYRYPLVGSLVNKWISARRSQDMQAKPT